jgi:hypothetical protein
MVGVGVGDDGATHPPPGIDVEVAGRAIEPGVGDFKQRG